MSLTKTPLKEINSQTQGGEKMESNNSFNFIINNNNNSKIQDQTFDSSNSTSPFISNPEIPITDVLDENSVIKSLYTDTHPESDEYSDVDQDSIHSNNHSMLNSDPSPYNNGVMNSADLHDDLGFSDFDNNNHSVVVHNNDSNSTFHESTVDTTKFNDTRAQFDQDFDFSPRRMNQMSILPNTQSNPITPWRRLRTASTFTPTKGQSNLQHPESMIRLPAIKQSLFPTTDNNNIETANANNASSTHASTVSKIADLNKQIGSYRIQIQLFKEFLQKIIDKHVINKDLLDENELAKFQFDLQGLSPTQSTRSTDYAMLESEYNKLLNDYQEVVDINNEIINNLQNFEEKLHDKDLHIAQLNEDISICSSIIDEIMHNIATNSNTAFQSREKLQDILTSPDNISWLEKLEALKKESEHLILPSPPASSGKEDNKHQPVIDNLIATVNDLQLKLNNQKNEKEKLEELRKDIDDSQSMKRNFQFMSSKFIELCQTFNENGEAIELEKMKEENERISKELADLKAQTSNQARQEDEDIKTEIEELKQHNQALIEDLDETNKIYEELKQESAESISALSSQLQARQKEIVALRNDKRMDQKLRDEIDAAAEVERKLKAENIKLSYALETSKEKEVNLKVTIESLTEKINALQESGHQSRSQSVSSDGDINEYQKYLNHQLNDIVQFDTQEFQRLIKSFNKIADDSSLKDPIKKYDMLMKKVNSQDIATLDQDNMEFLRDCHRSVFNYFVRAVDILVNDHIRLLLKETENEGKEDYIKDLHQRINELVNHRSVLAKQLESYDHQSNNVNNDTSPISKLRLEEVQIKWKMEREKRAYEYKESQKRFKELEVENARLRDLLSRQ
ncbi:hypothetical protein DFJ63DRAFT_335821 [Scheffersomyces coipomensis]|uniref:uncharacterized protein n=1 Tax=Scheffersomyces coipomensis TaxID=1788519 RepID=UPI00315DDD34